MLRHVEAGAYSFIVDTNNFSKTSFKILQKVLQSEVDSQENNQNCCQHQHQHHLKSCKKCYKVKLILRKIIKIVANGRHIYRLKCITFDLGWGSAPDPAGRAHSAPQTP